jgi:hypothetical protein
MTIPDAAIEAAAEATYKHVVHLVHPPHLYKTICACGWNGSWLHDNQFDAYSEHIRHLAQIALEAAMPAIREHIAQQIEALSLPSNFELQTYNDGLRDEHKTALNRAARIVRGGAP